MEEKDEGVVSKRLSTMLRIDTLNELTNKCKEDSDPFGKWSYELGIRKLLEISKFIEMFSTVWEKLNEFEKRIKNLETKEG